MVFIANFSIYQQISTATEEGRSPAEHRQLNLFALAHQGPSSQVPKAHRETEAVQHSGSNDYCDGAG